MSERLRRPASFAILGLVVAFGLGAASEPDAGTASEGPPPCGAALPLYTKIGTLSDVDGSHRRTADVEARLEILRQGRNQPRAARVGWAYVDGEGDIWVAIRNTDTRGLSDWQHVAPGIGTRSPVYALVERVGIPKGYRLSACVP